MFPLQVLETAIRDEIAAANNDRPAPREVWEPEIDSLVMVRVILRIEEEIAIVLPDDVMPAGGVNDVEAWIDSVIQSCLQRWKTSRTVPQEVT